MRFASTAFALAVLLLSSTAAAGNSDEVNAGVDVTLTGGAVGHCHLLELIDLLQNACLHSFSSLS
jgi:hypothetical protein